MWVYLTDRDLIYCDSLTTGELLGKIGIQKKEKRKEERKEKKISANHMDMPSRGVTCGVWEDRRGERRATGTLC